MAFSGEFGSLTHLAGRFFGALLPFGPSRADEQWTQDQLLPGEQTLWRQMSGADRRHTVGVARRTVAELEHAQPDPSDDQDDRRPIVAAALLHDVGKVEAALGTWARAGVTFAAMAVGRAHLVDWSGARPDAPDAQHLGTPVRERTWRRRIGLYLGHDHIGAHLLADAGSDPLTVAWAREHHRPPERWSVDSRVGTALKIADDD